MKNVYQTVRMPLITEKSTIIREANGTYCFRVHIQRQQDRDRPGGREAVRKDKVKVADGPDRAGARARSSAWGGSWASGRTGRRPGFD